MNVAPQADAPAPPPALTQQENDERDIDVSTPMMAREWATGIQPSDPEPEGAMVDFESYSNAMPKEVQERALYRVYRPAHDANQNFWCGQQYWTMELETQTEKWVNGLMAYTSSHDPLGSTGPRWLAFASAEEASDFCKRNNIKHYVDTFPVKQPLEGKCVYAANFLSDAVRNRRARFTPKKLQNVQFSHAERGKDPWVNLKHTPFGAKASKTVSMTQWSDPHPNLHSAETWYARDLERRKELSRKLGK